MSKLNAQEYKRFEDIKYTRSDGGEFWLARELTSILDYSKWENFSKTIARAILACKNSGFEIADHFPEVGKMIDTGKGAQRKVKDFELPRYACYVVQKNYN